MIIPVYFTVAGYFQMDNTYAAAVLAGTLLSLQNVTTAYVPTGVTACVTPATASSQVVGIAGDDYHSDLPAHASGYASDIVINATGQTTRGQVRISDNFKETLGSGEMTVYSGVGTFRTDQYDLTVMSWTLGQKLYSNASGLITNSAGAGNVVGHLVGAPAAFPSGVPGTDVQGSISLGTLLTFTLNV